MKSILEKTPFADWGEAIGFAFAILGLAALPALFIAGLILECVR